MAQNKVQMMTARYELEQDKEFFFFLAPYKLKFGKVFGYLETSDPVGLYFKKCSGIHCGSVAEYGRIEVVQGDNVILPEKHLILQGERISCRADQDGYLWMSCMVWL